MAKEAEQEFSDPTGRRRFLKLTGCSILAAFSGALIPDIEIPIPRLPSRPVKITSPLPSFRVNLHNAHALPNHLGVTNRLPLSRRFFDEGSRMKDPFYGLAKALQDYRKNGANTIMTMEIHPQDSDYKLAKMFDKAQEIVHFRSGDTVVLGNEINISGVKYPTDTYARQATFLQRHIRGLAPQVQIGLAGEAMYGDETVLRNILPKIDFPFVQPFHHYSLPQQIPQRYVKLRATLDSFGFSQMPISIGETGVADNSFKGNPDGFLTGTPQEQADAIYKAFCFAKYAGCQSVTWYSAIDTPNVGFMERHGLLTDNFSKRLAFWTYIKAADIFNQAETITMKHKDSKYIFVLRGKNAVTEISWFCPDQNSLGGSVTVTQRPLNHFNSGNMRQVRN